MFCPQCGTQQVSSDIRFCSRCGFPLQAVAEILARGGQLPVLPSSARSGKLSPRQKGVRQGAILMLSTLLLVPLVAIISVFILKRPEIFVPVTAIICFIGGLLRIIYALLCEEKYPTANEQATPPRESSILTSARAAGNLNAANPSALPPHQASNFIAPLYQPPARRNTGEIIAPPSVTENTTRLLETPPSVEEE